MARPRRLAPDVALGRVRVGGHEQEKVELRRTSALAASTLEHRVRGRRRRRRIVSGSRLPGGQEQQSGAELRVRARPEPPLEIRIPIRERRAPLAAVPGPHADTRHQRLDGRRGRQRPGGQVAQPRALTLRLERRQSRDGRGLDRLRPRGEPGHEREREQQGDRGQHERVEHGRRTAPSRGWRGSRCVGVGRDHVRSRRPYAGRARRVNRLRHPQPRDARHRQRDRHAAMDLAEVLDVEAVGLAQLRQFALRLAGRGSQFECLTRVAARASESGGELTARVSAWAAGASRAVVSRPARSRRIRVLCTRRSNSGHRGVGRAASGLARGVCPETLAMRLLRKSLVCPVGLRGFCDGAELLVV